MVLNMADFDKFCKSLQTLWNGSKTLPNWFLTPCTTVSVDFGWIRKARKLADFEQKAWAIAHGFEHGRFWQVLQIAPNTLKRFQNPPKLIFNYLHDCFRRFRVNSQGSFWARAIAVLNMADFDKFCKFRNPSGEFFVEVNSQDSKIGRFWAKSLGYSPWFWTWPILTSPGNRSKLTETVPKPS